MARRFRKGPNWTKFSSESEEVGNNTFNNRGCNERESLHRPNIRSHGQSRYHGNRPTDSRRTWRRDECTSRPTFNYSDDRQRNRRENWNQCNDDSNFCDRPKSRQRHPPGLTGREIGLWYARLNSSRKPNDTTFAPRISMDENKLKDLNEALNKFENDSQSNVLKDRIEKNDMYFTESSTKLSMDVACSNFQMQGEESSNLKSEHANDIKASSQFKFRDVPLVKDEVLDLKYHDELTSNMSSRCYNEMLNVRKKLPSYEMREEILQTIYNNQVVVLSGETGCGKTTQVGQFILDDLILSKKGSMCHIICTQPRRLSTLSVSKRVAEERNETLGNSVGYQIRLDSKTPRSSGSILFCTTGIVLQRLMNNSSLSAVSHIILDEIHERDTDSDFLMCIVKDLMKLRPNLKVILMSATLNAEKFSKYFGNCPMIHIPGFSFDVKEYYLEDALKVTNFSYEQNNQETKNFTRRKSWRAGREVVATFRDMIEPYLRSEELQQNYSSSVIHELSNPESEELNLNLVLELLRHISRQPPGAVLIFLPGWDNISKLNKLIEEDRYFNFNNFMIIPLHSLMPTINQRQIFDKPAEGIRKVVIATNIAETSITINDVVYVIDGGKIKMRNYDKNSHISTLKAEWVTLANAKQRRGRAGRVQDGICYHLYSRARKMILDQFPLPEIQRTRLEEVILKIKILKLGSCQTFLTKLMDAPDQSIIDVSLKMLTAINALDDDENLTPLGIHLARLPMDPLIGKMLLMSTIFSCVDPILTVAAMLSFKDPFVTSLGQESAVDKSRKIFAEGHQSDHLMYTLVYNRWERSVKFNNDKQFTRNNFLSQSVLKEIQNLRKQLLGILYDNNFIDTKDPHAKSINHNASNLNLVKAVLTAGLYPNVGRIWKKNQGWNQGSFKSIGLPGNVKAQFHPKSVNEKSQQPFTTDWLVYWEKMLTNKTYLFDSTAVSSYPLLLFGEKFNYDREEGIVHVDDFVNCKCTEELAFVMKKLRKQLNELLEYRIANPRTTDWAESTVEKQFLSIVVKTLNE